MLKWGGQGGLGWGAIVMMALLGCSATALAQDVPRPPDPPKATAAAPGADASKQPKGSCPPKAFCEHADVGPPKSPPPADEGAATADTEEPPVDEPSEMDAPAQPLDSEHHNWTPQGDDPSTDDDWKWQSRSDDEGMGPVTSAGLIIFGVGYAPPFLTGLVAAAIEDSEDGDTSDAEKLLPLLLPVAGPPITGALVDASPEVWTVLVVDSAVQAAGLIILGLGAALDNADDAEQSGRPVLLPHVGRVGRSGMTLGVMGTF